MIETNRIVYYDETETEYCILYASIARVGIIRIKSGPNSDELPNDWQSLVLAALDNFSDDCSIIRDGDDLYLRTDYISNIFFQTVCKTIVNAIFDCVRTSYLVVRSVSENKHDGIAYVYFKDVGDRSIAIDADLRDQHIESIDTTKCIANATIVVTAKGIQMYADFEEILRMVCGTINEYLPQITL